MSRAGETKVVERLASKGFCLARSAKKIAQRRETIPRLRARRNSVDTHELGRTRRYRRSLSPAGFTANDVVPLDHCGHAHPGTSVFHAAFDAHDLAESTYKHLGPVGNLRGERQSNVQLGAGFQILVENEIETPRRNVPGLSFLC